MESVRDAIAGILRADPALRTLLPGGIHTRSLRREGPGRTPNAFTPTPPHQLRPCAVVIEEADTADFLGPVGAYLGSRRVVVYAPAHDGGRQAVNGAVERIGVLLTGVTVAEAGRGVEVTVGDRRGPRDSDGVEGAVEAEIGLRVVGLLGVF